MSDELEAQTGFLSLAELASMDTDSVQTLTSRVFPAGVFDVSGVSVEGKQGEARDDGRPPLTRFNYRYKVEGGTAVDKDVDVEQLVGRELTESYTLWPDQMKELLGLLKGRYQKVGLQNSGMPLGGVPGMEPGWLDGFVGHQFQLRVRTYISKGETRQAFDWMEKPKAALEDEPA